MKPDGVDEAEPPRVIVEAYARVDKLKGGQLHKVARDILKLVTVKSQLAPEAELYLLFASGTATATVKGKSWLASAAKAAGIQVEVAQLPEEQIERIRATQDRQNMQPAPPV